MERLPAKTGSELFIVDNSDKDWKVRNYLEQWADLSVSFDIATGFFEIGALLALDGQWQKLEKLRILMGDEVSRRTKQAMLAGVQTAGMIIDASIEKEKERIKNFVKRSLLPSRVGKQSPIIGDLSRRSGSMSWMSSSPIWPLPGDLRIPVAWPSWPKPFRSISNLTCLGQSWRFPQPRS